MGKTGFWLRGAKGKLAGTVMYQSGGETIQREIVTPKNPQSDSQMRQRVMFAAASKFYSQAQQNRFALAFQNKPTNNSEFNAFMRANIKEELFIFPTKEQVNDPNFPLINPWIVAQGNLPTIDTTPNDDGIDIIACTLKIAGPNGTYTNWDDVINANPELGLKYGDIITYTFVLTDSTFDDATGNVVVGRKPMYWDTRQIIIGDDLGTDSLENYLLYNGFIGDGCAIPTDEGHSYYLGIDIEDECNTYFEWPDGGNNGFQWIRDAAMTVCTLSRREGGKLRVSNSKFVCTPVAQQIYTRISYDSQLREAIASYKADESNAVPTQVLQGSIAKAKPSFKYAQVTASPTDVNPFLKPSFGETVQLTTLDNVITVSVYDSEPSSKAPHKLSLSGTGASGATFKILSYKQGGIGSNKPNCTISLQMTGFSSATQVNLNYEGTTTLLVLKKPTT